MLDLCIAAFLASSAVAVNANDLRVAVTAAHQSSGLAALEWDVLSAFARLSRLQVSRIDAADAAAAVRAVVERRADVVISGGAGTPDAGIVWSDDVVPTRFVVMTRGPAAPVAYVEDLRGRSVAAGGAAAQRVAEEGKVRARPLPDAAAALAALQGGQADAVLVDMFDALALRRRDGRLELGVFVGPRHALRFAMRADDPRMASLNRHLAQLRASSTWGMLLARHLGPAGMETLGRARLSVR